MSFFGIFHTGPHPAPFTADLHCYYSKLQKTAVSQLSSEKCVYGLLTSKGAFPVTRGELSLPVSAQVNAAIHAPAICRAASTTSAKTTYDTEVRSNGERRIIAAPCWLPCTGRRTSVCLIDLRTLLEQSSVCSHVRRELQREREKQLF